MTAFVLPCSGAAASEVISPLPSSDYAVRAACAAPSFQHAGCLALQLVPLSAQARERSRPIGMVRPASAGTQARSPAAGDFGLRPQDLHSAYALPDAPEIQQTVALIDAYNDPTAEADLKAYDEEFGLPVCTTANGCFRKVGESGSPTILPFPKTSQELTEASSSSSPEEVEEAEEAIGWGVEISLDIESAHATCEGCHILLVEANTTSYADLGAAERTAESLGADEVSNSWGGPEQGVSVEADANGPFNDPQVVITAAAGDNGFLGWDAAHENERGFTNYPAASPHVVAVGGTRLTLGSGGSWKEEAVWNGDGASGGGCSVQFTAPLWQQQASDFSSVGCSTKRAVSDVAADADPHTGVAITDSSSACLSGSLHWCTYGGTSLASPIIASVFALAGGANGVAYPSQTLYESESNAPATLHDVTSGSNGKCATGFNHTTGLSNCTAKTEAQASCAGKLSCLAESGYDGPTGVGTPDGVLGFEPGQKEEAGGGEEAPGEETAEEESAGEETPEEGAPKEESKKEEEQAPEEKPVSKKEGGGGETPPPSSPTPEAPKTTTPPSSPVDTSSRPAATIEPSLVPTPLNWQVSGLNLTTNALIALDRHRPSTSKVGFSFMVNFSGHVRVSLARKVHAHGHSSWQTLPGSATITVVTGRNSRHLSGRHALSTGFYRLTLTPATGASARSILFHIG